MGWKYGRLMSSLAAFLIATMSFVFVVAYIENTPRFVRTFGSPGVSEFLGNLGIDLPQEGRWAFYRQVVSVIVCSSEIALAQIVLLYSTVFLGMRLLFSWLGAMASGERVPNARGVQVFTGMAVILLPALGILSTVVGILSSGHVSKEETRIIIFGPTGLGIFGYIVALCVNSFAEYLDER